MEPRVPYGEGGGERGEGRKGVYVLRKNSRHDKITSVIFL